MHCFGVYDRDGINKKGVVLFYKNKKFAISKTCHMTSFISSKFLFACVLYNQNEGIDYNQ